MTQSSPLSPSSSGMMSPQERGAFGVLGVTLLALSLKNRSALGTALLGAAGAGLSAVALRGNNPAATALKIEQLPSGDVLIRDAVTVGGKQPEELYHIWRDLPGLPLLMTHLKSVEVLDDKHSRWTASGPVGDVSWEAELTADEPGQRIAWRSLPGAAITNSGEVLFRPAPGKRGTEVVVHLTYQPPLGTTGAIAARLFNQEPSQQVRDDLMKFKREQELGFAPTTKGQSSGRTAEPQKNGEKA